MADRLAEDGWKELGYEYVIIDDCWMSMLRDEQGKLQPEPSRLVYCWLGWVRGQRLSKLIFFLPFLYNFKRLFYNKLFRLCFFCNYIF